MSDIVLDMEGSVMKTHCFCCQRAPSLVGETDRYRALPGMTSSTIEKLNGCCGSPKEEWEGTPGWGRGGSGGQEALQR